MNRQSPAATPNRRSARAKIRGSGLQTPTKLEMTMSLKQFSTGKASIVAGHTSPLKFEMAYSSRPDLANSVTSSLVPGMGPPSISGQRSQ